MREVLEKYCYNCKKCIETDGGIVCDISYRTINGLDMNPGCRYWEYEEHRNLANQPITLSRQTLERWRETLKEHCGCHECDEWCKSCELGTVKREIEEVLKNA